MPQAGPGPTRDGSFDNLTYLNGVTNTIPRVAFFCVWNSFLTTHLAITDNLNASNLVAHPLIATRDEANWKYWLTFSLNAQRLGGSWLQINWQGGVLQQSDDLVNWQDVPAAPRPHLHDVRSTSQRSWRLRR